MRAWQSCVWIAATLLWGVGLGGCADGEAGADASAEDGAHAEAEHAELALHMARLQRWTHKSALALRARNPELADFYLHEMEEAIETIQTEAPTYEGHQIAKLTEEMLVPSVEAVDEELDARNWEAVDRRVQNVAQSCNQCHAATEHAFIRVDLQDLSTPYAQEFSAETP